MIDIHHRHKASDFAPLYSVYNCRQDFGLHHAILWFALYFPHSQLLYSFNNIFLILAIKCLWAVSWVKMEWISNDSETLSLNYLQFMWWAAPIHLVSETSQIHCLETNNWAKRFQCIFWQRKLQSYMFNSSSTIYTSFLPYAAYCSLLLKISIEWGALATYSVCLGFESLPGDRLSWQRFLVVFLNFSGRSSGQNLKLRYDRFPTNSFQSIIY
jgi:hypothetical protein